LKRQNMVHIFARQILGTLDFFKFDASHPFDCSNRSLYARFFSGSQSISSDVLYSRRRRRLM
jgi:hypothetical protein